MAAEGVGFDNICASGVVFSVNVNNPLRPREQKILRTVLELRPTPVLDCGIPLLEHGSHGTVQDENTAGESVVKCLSPECSRVHRDFLIVPELPGGRKY